jgi:hypothetical protein
MSQLSRRQFLAISGSGLAIASSLGSTGSVAAEAAKTKLRLGIQLFSLRNYPLDEALQHAKDLGFEQVEFYSKMLPIDSRELASTSPDAEVTRKRRRENCDMAGLS